MNKGVLAALAIVALLGIASVMPHSKAGGQTAEVAATQTATSSSDQQTDVQKFADSPLAAHAYLISVPQPYDAVTQTALAGFSVTQKALPDGTTQISLDAENPHYQSQAYTVSAGEKLYFIEMSMGDDQDGQDHMLRDDTAVLVDADGNIVQ